MTEAALASAVLGPAAAGAVWMALSRWALARWLAAGAVWLAAQAAMWWVVWDAYGGGSPSWAGLAPDLLRATLAALAALAVTVVVPGADRLPWRGGAPAVAGLAAATSALVAAAYTPSLVVLALLVPVPTIAAAAASLGGEGRRDAQGLIGLALADAVTLAGLAVLLDRGGTTLIGPVAGLDLGAALVLGGAAAKAGAIPWAATWRLAATGGPGAPATLVLRAQGVLLALVTSILVAEGAPSIPLAAAAGAAAMAAGAAALLARTQPGVRAAASGAAAAALFVPLGLGGTVGARAALFLFPAFLLAAAVVESGTPAPPAGRAHAAERGPRAPWRWVGGGALAVGVVSLAGLPPGGGFPGTWLSLALATVRAATEPVWLLAAGGAAVGLAVAALGAIRAVRTAAPRPATAVLALAASLGLLYLGVQPVRLGLGWVLRVERALGLPEVLPSSGAPGLPAAGGWDLLWVALPAAAIALAGAALTGGVRDRTPVFVPLIRADVPIRAPAPVRSLARPLGAAAARAQRLGAGYALAFLLEGAAFAVAAWVVLAGLRVGLL